MAFRDRVRRAQSRWPFHRHAAMAIGGSLASIFVAQALVLGWRDGSQIATLASIYGIAGIVGTLVGSWLATWLTTGGARGYAAWALLTGGLSMGLGAFIFALVFRAQYSQWHDPALTVGWSIQTIFTMAGAAYYWAVLGTRMILPWAIIPLAIGALAFARRSG